MDIDLSSYIRFITVDIDAKLRNTLSNLNIIVLVNRMGNPLLSNKNEFKLLFRHKQ